MNYYHSRRKKAGFIPVIPDIKCVSPKEGELLRGRDPVQLAKELAAAGASALSVVTEHNNFGGSCALLEGIAKAVELPVLRKDFIREVDDIKKTRDMGARAVLIICAMLPPAVLVKLYEEALRIGLEALVETCKEELLFAGQLGAKLVGINNRNIVRLELDNGGVSHASLIAHKPKGAVLISESGIRTPAEARR